MSKDIKIKSTVKGIKVLDKGADLSKNMKEAFVRTKDKAEETQQSTHDTPHAYATDKASENAKEVASVMAYKAEHFGRNSTKKVYNDIKAFRKNRKVAKVADNTIKTVSKGTIKTVQKSVKTTEKTSKATIKTTRQAVKTTAKTAQATVKASQKAAQTAKVAAKATAQAAKTAVKATVTTVKAIIASIKGLITLIAAGGWVAVIILIIICMIALIIASPFGVFGGGGANGTPTITEIIATVNSEWDTKIEQLKIDAGEVDETVITINGTVVLSTRVQNWVDVLSVYSVKTSTGDNPADVVELDSNRISILKSVFNDMNTVTSKTEETTNEDNNVITKLIIEITSKYYNDMILKYNFNAKQQEMLRELMSDENRPLWQQIIG